MIGLTGAHRTGKTTLAKCFAASIGVPFITSSASAVHERLGYKVEKNYPFMTRLEIQRGILLDAVRSYESAPEIFVSDRTPIDFLAYTLADIQRDNLSVEERTAAAEYVGDCFEALNNNFNLVALVPPAIPYVVESGKPLPNLPYQDHHHLICCGAMVDERSMVNGFFIDKDVITVEQRLVFLHNIYTEVMDELKEIRESFVFH